jgi:glycosyltransferase involved in cell wall biosynthesis
MKSIIVASTQYPYYGGAATNSYALIKYLRSHKYNVFGIFFDNSEGAVDPDGIGGVIKVKNGTLDSEVRNQAIKYLGEEPSFIFAKNYVAPITAKNIFNKSKVFYFVTGSPQMTTLSERRISAQMYLKTKIPSVEFAPEMECIKKSDYILPNSPIALELLIRNYGNNSNFLNPVDTSLAYNYNIDYNSDFKNRDYDFAFICSNFDRAVKNSDFTKKIFEISRLSRFKKIVIGKNSHIFKGTPNLISFNLLPQKELLDIVRRTKVVLCTSYYDASPNTIKEALMCGSNILVSKNCGWSETYPDEFVCSDVYNTNEWVSKATLLSRDKVSYLLKNNNSLIVNLKSLMGQS